MKGREIAWSTIPSSEEGASEAEAPSQSSCHQGGKIAEGVTTEGEAGSEQWAVGVQEEGHKEPNQMCEQGFIPPHGCFRYH